jgi:hypothetical protein
MCTYRINWEENGGLCCFNYPIDGTEDLKAIDGWYVNNQNKVIVPEESVFFPGWLGLLPCFWIHLCMMAPMSVGKAFVFYETESSLNFERRAKYLCFEIEPMRRVGVTRDDLELKEEGRWFPTKHARISIKSRDGMVDTSIWVKVLRNETEKYDNLVRTLNARAERFIQLYPLSLSPPLAYAEAESPAMAVVVPDPSPQHIPSPVSPLPMSMPQKDQQLPGRTMQFVVPQDVGPGYKLQIMTPEKLIVEVFSHPKILHLSSLKDSVCSWSFRLMPSQG